MRKWVLVTCGAIVLASGVVGGLALVSLAFKSDTHIGVIVGSMFAGFVAFIVGQVFDD